MTNRIRALKSTPGWLIDHNFDWGYILTLHPQKGLSKFALISKSKQKTMYNTENLAALEQLRILPQDMAFRS